MKFYFLSLLIYFLCNQQIFCSQQEYIAISLGYRCQVAQQLGFNGLRTAAYPFDWLITPFNSLYKLIDFEFVDFFDKKNLQLRTHFYYEDDGGHLRDPRYLHVWEKKYNVLFRHHFQFNENYLDAYDIIREKYKRRIQRFYDTLRSGKYIYFFRRVITKKQAIILTDLIGKKFPELAYTLVAIDYTQEVQEKWDIPNVRNYYLPIPVPYDRDGDHAKWWEIFNDLGLIPDNVKPFLEKDFMEFRLTSVEKMHKG